MNYKLKTDWGKDFTQTAKEAKIIAIEKKVIVEFKFNGIKCLVAKDTNTYWLLRDYQNAFIMKWKQVGHECLTIYNKKTSDELKKRRIKQAEDEEQECKEYEEKNRKEREKFETKTKGVKIELIDKKTWDEWKAKNTDGYGSATFEYAESWAMLMQDEMVKGKKLIDCAKKTSFECDFFGITGFMYGMAVSILSKCWKYGEELRKWHNKDYGHKGKGVINPAILTLKTKSKTKTWDKNEDILE